MRFTIRKARFRSKFGTPAWSVYDGAYYSGIGIYRGCYRHRRKDGSQGYGYTIQRENVDWCTFWRLKDAVAWLNMSELEKIVAAIG